MRLWKNSAKPRNNSRSQFEDLMRDSKLVERELSLAEASDSIYHRAVEKVLGVFHGACPQMIITS
jgi:hypothetical protein